jgi:hypothetical protein
MLMTLDESWFVLEYQHSTKWCAARDEIPMAAPQTIGTQKVISRVVWRMDGFQVANMMPPGGVSTPGTSLLI